MRKEGIHVSRTTKSRSRTLGEETKRRETTKITGEISMIEIRSRKKSEIKEEKTNTG